jgi:hypothetical protein
MLLGGPQNVSASLNMTWGQARVPVSVEGIKGVVNTPDNCDNIYKVPAAQSD